MTARRLRATERNDRTELRTELATDLLISRTRRAIPSSRILLQWPNDSGYPGGRLAEKEKERGSRKEGVLRSAQEEEGEGEFEE